MAPTDGPLVRVVSVVGLSEQEALAAADEVAVELGEHQVAIVLGAASVLCDQQRGELYEARRDTLKVGGETYGCALAAAFKLPRGLWREAHRLSLGVWVLQGGITASRVVVAGIGAQPMVAAGPDVSAHDRLVEATLVT